MRELPRDIIIEMKSKFKSDFNSVITILMDYLSKYEYLNSNRIIRCVVFLAKNDIESFKYYLESAKIDPRDVIWWAEYHSEGLVTNRRTRDFGKPFSEKN